MFIYEEIFLIRFVNIINPLHLVFPPGSSLCLADAYLIKVKCLPGLIPSWLSTQPWSVQLWITIPPVPYLYGMVGKCVVCVCEGRGLLASRYLHDKVKSALIRFPNILARLLILG